MSTVEDEKEFEKYYVLVCEYSELKRIPEPDREIVRPYYDEKEPYTQVVTDILNLYDC